MAAKLTPSASTIYSLPVCTGAARTASPAPGQSLRRRLARRLLAAVLGRAGRRVRTGPAAAAAGQRSWTRRPAHIDHGAKGESRRARLSRTPRQITAAMAAPEILPSPPMMMMAKALNHTKLKPIPISGMHGVDSAPGQPRPRGRQSNADGHGEARHGARVDADHQGGIAVLGHPPHRAAEPRAAEQRNRARRSPQVARPAPNNAPGDADRPTTMLL